ncbi:hypothetical protein EXIGLDRAFT_635040 [Exidia glandulosa HHB12029]|uniref:Uncharacterized protein n=1 Tax=Exidia glandulosa HHB12029 TaxID=1314781 RepID=A0A165QKW5_EXIGL|nr:hypothetical protein EXIGLDRAFT_635040 [Exidia glandulosa HHB12029]
MQVWLSYPLYILGLFAFGPAADQGALVSWTLQLLRLVLFLLVTRRFIAPFILAKLSNRIRVRSISLRSVRGLYYKQGELVWNVDRIGLAYHRPTKERPRRFAIQVEGLRLNVQHVPGAAHNNAATHSTAAIHKRLSSLFIPPPTTPVVAHPNWRSSALTPLRLLAHALDPFARPMLRMLFLAGFRILVRCLPALTQVLEFEMDSAVVSFEVLRGAHVRVSGVTVSTQVQFEGLETIRGAAADEAVRGFAFGNFAGWNTRVRASAGRLWDRGWGNTRGAASVAVKIGEVVGSTQPLALDGFVESPLEIRPSNAVRKGTFLAIRCPVDLRAALRFDPRRVKVDRHSLDMSVDVAGIEVMADVLQALVDLVEEAQRAGPGQEYFSTGRSFSPPTSPLLGAWKEMNSRGSPNVPVLPGKKKPSGLKRLAPFLKNVRIGLQSVTTTFRTPETAYLYRLSLDSFTVQARLSTPTSNRLHQRWLGSTNSQDCGEGVVFDVTTDLRTLALERSEGPGVSDMWTPLVAVTRIDCRTLITDVVFGVKSRNRIFAGDPNSAFVVCELIVDNVSVTERIDAVNESLAQAELAAPRPTTKRTALPSQDMPRIRVDLLVRNVDLVLLRRADNVTDVELAVHTRTERFEFHAETMFVPDCASKSFSASAPVLSEPSPLSKLRFNGTAILHPVFTRMTIQGLPEHLIEVAQEPFISLDKVEVFVSGDAYALPTEDVAVVNTASVMADISCVSDALSIELWNPHRVDALAKLVSSINVSKQPKTMTTAKAPLDILPSGVNARASVGEILIIVTGPDLNPDCPLELSRGLAVKSSASLSYCFMQPSHSERTRSQRLRTGSNRQRLGLQEDLLVQAVAKANAQTSPDDLVALVHMIVWQTSCRVAVATEVAADHENAANTFRLPHSPNGPAVVSAPMIVGRIALQRKHQRALFDSQRHADTCDAQVILSRLAATYNLLNVYCALLAADTLRKLVPKRSATTSKPPSQLQVSLRLSIEVFDMFFGLARGQRVFFRVESISVEKFAKVLRARFHALKAFVPSVTHPEDATSAVQWDELGQLKALSASVTETDARERDIAVAADSLCIRVASGFKISDLILDIGVAVKAVKHLYAMVALGTFLDHPPPEAEGAKVVPNIQIRVETVVLEVEDLVLDRKLNLIWQAGSLAQPVRLEREAAFDAKCAAILREGSPNPLVNLGSKGRYNFSAKHTVSIADARDRLNMLHSLSWARRFNQSRTEQIRFEEQAARRVRTVSSSSESVWPIQRRHQDFSTPLIRLQIAGLDLKLSQPSFELSALPDVLHDLGNGMPRDMQYTLLIPLHLEASFKHGTVQLRDYPLPLLYVPQHPAEPVAAFEFSTDLIIAEEIGPAFSTKWVQCPVVPADSGIPGAHPLLFAVPKTAMPVKTYARPTVRVLTTETTHISWGVSYLPVMQEVLRFVDTLTTPPDDNANPVGFWDKLRLVMHWQVRASFTGPVRFVLKGSRDPHSIIGAGAGFGLSWQGGTEVTVGYTDEAQELVQVTSDTMQLIIPDLQRFTTRDPRRAAGTGDTNSQSASRSGTQKVCAKFTNGVRMGLGFVFERTCAPKCADCPEDPFYRKCRLFDFKPHYRVQTRASSASDGRDSFEGFRSDFIHMSFSLTTPTMPTPGRHGGHNNIYLSPLAFQHFWHWWDLFDNSMSLRIRQGKLFPDNVKETKKFGRFIATIKYRFYIEKLFITHIYQHDTREAWTKGETPFIGVKAFMQSFHADLHQSTQEISLRRAGKDAVVSKHKKFNAVEVVIAGLELRAMAAVFAEPHKQLITLKRASDESLRPWDDMEPHDVRSRWVDLDDFVELMWSAADRKPRIYLSHLASCPRFMFSKQAACREPWVPQSTIHGVAESSAVSKFGTEHSHLCFLGKEPSAKQTQMDLASQRLQHLLGERFQLSAAKSATDSPTSLSSVERVVDSPTDSVLTPEQSLDKKIELLQEYIEQLNLDSPDATGQVYYVAADSVDSSAWAEFGNVYHVHSPNIFVNNSNRNLLLTYYQASRKRRGFEYHMATRAVKFLHDLAVEDSTRGDGEGAKGPWTAVGGAQAAVDVFRNLLIAEKTSTEDHSRDVHEPFSPEDPLRGWSDGVALSKSHYCVLFKPQFVLQSQKIDDACVVVTASDISLQNFLVIDIQNQDDPVTGHIMNRNHAAVNGLQVFSPTTALQPLEARKRLSHNVPLEVLVDYRCECNDFDRLVPQTEAVFHYDKFNRNRPRASASTDVPSHIAHQMDLVVVNMPRFSVAAKCKNFEAISSVVTDLILFSDPAHKSRVERLETFIFSYDFTDLDGAADLVAKLQARIRQLQVIERGYVARTDILDATERLDLLSIHAQIFVLAEELNLVFDAIAMAQDQNSDLHEDQQSALKLVVSSKEISWHMLDDRASLLAKLEVLGVVFSWLSKQDGSTSNDLVLKDARALHSSPTALWPEILIMHDQPANHPMVKAKQFAHAVWSVLPPVGGIPIYQNFQLDLHPIRLQIEAEIGRKLLEYVWPARRARNGTQLLLVDDGLEEPSTNDSSTTTLDRQKARQDTLSVHGLRERGLTRPRSHNNLRVQARPTLHRFKSSTALNDMNDGSKSDDDRRPVKRATRVDQEIDAAAMRARSTQQKTFFRVHIPRIHVLLSARSDDFFCNEAQLYTNEININNKTTSFEDMVTQYMPAVPNWKGWVRLVWSQDVIPVLPVAKELFAKTKWGSKAAASQKNLLRSGTTMTSPTPVRQGSKHFWNRNRKNSEEADHSSRPRSRSRPRTDKHRHDSSPAPHPRHDNIIISVQEPSPSVDRSFP